MNQDQQVTLLFEPQDTWFFQELRPGNSLWLGSQFPPPVRAFEGAIRSLLAQTCAQHNPLARSLRLAGPWPCIKIAETWERLYPWPLHIVSSKAKDGQIQTNSLQPAEKPSHCDLGNVRLPTAKGEAAGWRALEGHWLTREDFIKLLEQPQAGAEIEKAHDIAKPSNGKIKARKLSNYFERETRLGIARESATALSEEGKLFQTEHLRFKPNFAFALTVRVAPHPKTGNIQPEKVAQLKKLREYLANGMPVRLGAEGRMAHVSLLATNTAVSDAAIISEKVEQSAKTQKVVLIATSAMDFNGNWLPQVEYPANEEEAGAANTKAIRFDCKQNFQPDPVTPGQAQTWSAIFHDKGERFNLKLYSAVIGKRQVEGSSQASASKVPQSEEIEGLPTAELKQSKNLGHGARALIPPGSVWFGELLHGDFQKLVRTRLGIGKKLGRGEFALATWNEGEATCK